MSSSGFQPSITAIKWLQTFAVDGTAAMIHNENSIFGT